MAYLEAGEKRRVHMRELYKEQDTERRIQAERAAYAEKEAEVVYNIAS